MMGEERKKGGGEATTLPCETHTGNGGPALQQNGAPGSHAAANNVAPSGAPVAPGTNSETLPRAGKQGDLSAGFLRTARAGQLEKVLEYLDSGVDINTSNQNGLNALHLAAKDGHLEIVRELLSRGAIVDAATKKGNTALHIASLAGQEEVVHLLVERGASVNAQSQNGFTPLYMAAQENHDSVVKFLLNKGANQTLATEDGFTPLAVAMQQGHDKVVAVLLENDTRGKVRLPALHIAAKKDDCKAAALLLQKDHNPDVTSKSGFTPLHIAAHYGNDRIASLLYDKGADVNFAAKHNITPMHVAAKWGKIKMVNLLISKGANIEAKTRDGLTPLHCAARSGHHEVVDILIEKGAPIGSKTKNGLAPLHMASQGDHVDAARILLYHRAPVDEVTVDYLTALHVAAHCGHVRVAKLLLDRNADPNARALNGFTPLHIACKKNRIKVVELLLKHKASIEATTESGLTPLHVASFMGCMNIVIYLLQHEASPDIPTVRGETPLHLAARANQTDIIRILLRNGAQVDARAREEQTPLHVASRLGNVDIVMLLLQHGADVDATTKDVYTPLHIAAKEGQEEVASVLLDNGASLTTTTKKGFTPLHLAAKYGNMNVARLLLQKNAPVDAQGKNGVTPLHVASHYDHQNVALLLLDKGASPHAMAKNGHTPLHIAARKNQMDIATTLLEYGAKANAESKAGFTPLHLSAQEGHTDMSTLLIEHKADTNHKAKNGLTPLHLCAQEDKVNVASILVKNGAQIDAKTKAGYTPLHVAAHFGQAQMVRFLLSSGASVNCSTSAGYTPLHHAAQQGHTLVINLLLEGRAQPNLVTKNGQTALDIAQKLGYITVVETLKVVTETIITTSHTITIEEKYKVQAPESMQETFMSDSEDEGGGEEIGMAAMNVYGQPPHAQHVYLPSYYQGQLTYTREDPMLSDHQQYQYMTGDDMKSMGDDSMRVNVTDDERDNRHSGVPIITEMITKESCYRQNMANLKPDNIDINRHPVHVGASLESLNSSLAALGIVPKGQGMWRDSIPSWRNFLVSFLVDARGGAMRGCRHSGVRVIVPPRKATMPMRVTCRYLKRDKLSHPPPLMEGEALASRILELAPVAAKFLGPVIIEVPHFASLRGKEREIVILRSDNGETWREHTLEASEEAVQDVLNESFEGEELSQLEDLQTSRIVRILTVDFPHYFAVVSRIRQEVHAVGPEGGTVSSSAVPQVQAIFPPAALTKKIRVGLQAHPIPAELVAKLLGNRVAVSPIVTVEPRRRKFHKPISLTVPLPQAANKGMINQYSGDAPTLRLLCSITGGQSRAVWEDVTGSTPLTFLKDCVSFTTTVSARFWLMDCRNISEATKMATELYTHATHVPFMAKFVVFAKRTDPLEARLRVFCMTDDKEDKTLEHQEHFTEVAKSRDVEVLEGKTQYLEFAGNLIPVLKSGEQLQLPFRAFKENRIPFTVRIKDPDAADMMGRIMFMNEPKVAKGEPAQTPICTLNILLPDKISPGGNSELDLLELSKNYSFLRDGGLSRPDAIHRATIRLTDIANLLDKDWENLALELNVTPNEISQIKEEHPDKTAQQATAMFKLWQSNGNKATGNTLEKALNKIGREDIVKKCIFNVELVTDDVEKAVARVRLDQPGFDTLKDELGPSRDTSLRRDATMDPKMDPDFEEPDRMKDSESVEDLSITGAQNLANQRITITNGNVYNATSTPIKDKYASDEKELVDDMSDFIEHKYHTTDTMVKHSRDELDDDNKKRQEVLEEAKRIVSGVKRDAEKEKIKLSKKGWSVVYDNDVRKNDEVGYVVKQPEGSFSVDSGGVSEVPVIRQQCIIGTNGDRTITTITTRTIITTGEDSLSNLTSFDEDNHDVTDFSDLKISARDDDPIRIGIRSGESLKNYSADGIEDILAQTKNPSESIEKSKDGVAGRKKDKPSGMFTGIFRTPKFKKSKSKDSQDVSLDSGDEEIKVSTAKLLDDIRRMSESAMDDPSLVSISNSSKQIENKHDGGEDSTEYEHSSDFGKNVGNSSFFDKFKSSKRKNSHRTRPRIQQPNRNLLSDDDDASKIDATDSVIEVQLHAGESVESEEITGNTDDTRLQNESGYREHPVVEGQECKTDESRNATSQSGQRDHEKAGGLLSIFRSPKSKTKKSKAEKTCKKTVSNLTDTKSATGDNDCIKSKTEKFLEYGYAPDVTDVCPPESLDLREEFVTLEKQKQFVPTLVKESKKSLSRDSIDTSRFKESSESSSQVSDQVRHSKKIDDNKDEQLSAPSRNMESPNDVRYDILPSVDEDGRTRKASEASKLKDSSPTVRGSMEAEPKVNTETIIDSAELVLPKSKKKARGLFSGILKNAKYGAEEITQEVKEFADETTKEAEQEEVNNRKAAENVRTSIRYGIEKCAEETEKDAGKLIQDASAIGSDLNKRIELGMQLGESSRENSSSPSRSVAGYDTPKSGDDSSKGTTSNVTEIPGQKLKKKKAKKNALFSGIFSKVSKETPHDTVNDGLESYRQIHHDPHKENKLLDVSTGKVTEYDEKSDDNIPSADFNSARNLPYKITDSAGLDSRKNIDPEIMIESQDKSDGGLKHKVEHEGKMDKKRVGLISGIVKGAKNAAGDVAHAVEDIAKEAKQEAIQDEQKIVLKTNHQSEVTKDSGSRIDHEDGFKKGGNLVGRKDEEMEEQSLNPPIVTKKVTEVSGKTNEFVVGESVASLGVNENLSADDNIRSTKDLLEDMKSTASSLMYDISEPIRIDSDPSQDENLASRKDAGEKKDRKKGSLLSGFFKKISPPSLEAVNTSQNSVDSGEILTGTSTEGISEDVKNIGEKVDPILGNMDRVVSKSQDETPRADGIEKNLSLYTMSSTSALVEKTDPRDSIPVVYGEHRGIEKDTGKTSVTVGLSSTQNREKPKGFLTGIFKHPKQSSKEITVASRDPICEVTKDEITNTRGELLEHNKNDNIDGHAGKGQESGATSVACNSEFARSATEDFLRDMQLTSSISELKFPTDQIDRGTESPVSTEKSIKKGNLLSDLVKIPKYAAEKVRHDIQDFVRETKQEAQEEKIKSKAKTGRLVDNAKVDANGERKDSVRDSNQTTAEDEETFPDNVDDSSGKELPTEFGDDASKTEKSNLIRDVGISDDTKNLTRKHKKKTSNLLSGLIKSTKSNIGPITGDDTLPTTTEDEITSNNEVDSRNESQSNPLTEGNVKKRVSNVQKDDILLVKSEHEGDNVDRKKSKESKSILTGLLDGAKHVAGDIIHGAEDFAKKTKEEEIKEETKIETEMHKVNEHLMKDTNEIENFQIGLESREKIPGMEEPLSEEQIQSKNEYSSVQNIDTDGRTTKESGTSVEMDVSGPNISTKAPTKKKASRLFGGIFGITKDSIEPVHAGNTTFQEDVTTEDGVEVSIQDDKIATKQLLEDIRSNLMATELPLNVDASEILKGSSFLRETENDDYIEVGQGSNQSTTRKLKDGNTEGNITGSDNHQMKDSKSKSKGFLFGIFKTVKQSTGEVDEEDNKTKLKNGDDLENQGMLTTHSEVGKFVEATTDGIENDQRICLLEISSEGGGNIENSQDKTSHGLSGKRSDESEGIPSLQRGLPNIGDRIVNEKKNVRSISKIPKHESPDSADLNLAKSAGPEVSAPEGVPEDEKTKVLKKQEKSGGLFSSIFKGPKKTNDDSSDSKIKLINEEEKSSKGIIDREMESVDESDNAVMNIVISGRHPDIVLNATRLERTAESEIMNSDGRPQTGGGEGNTNMQTGSPSNMSDSNKSVNRINNHDELPSSKKNEKNSSGFLSGILKNAKDAAGNVAHEVGEFVQKTEQKVLQEEGMIKSKANKTPETANKKLKSQLNDSGNKISVIGAEVGGEIVATIQGHEPSSHEETVKPKEGEMNVKLNVEEEMTHAEAKGTDRIHLESTQSKIVHTSRENSKEKSEGFFSNILRGAKSSSKDAKDHKRKQAEETTEKFSRVRDEAELMIGQTSGKADELDGVSAEVVDVSKKMTNSPKIVSQERSTPVQTVKPDEEGAKKTKATRVVVQPASDQKAADLPAESEIGDNRSPQSKKKVKKTGGLLSGVFKGAKSAVQGMAHEIEESIETSERNIIEEERTLTSKVSKASNEAKDGLQTELHGLGKKVSKTAHHLQKEVGAGLEEGRLKLHEELGELEKSYPDEKANVKVDLICSDVTVDRMGADSEELKGRQPTVKEYKEGGVEFLSSVVKNPRISGVVSRDDKEKVAIDAEETKPESEEKIEDMTSQAAWAIEGSIESGKKIIDESNTIKISSESGSQGKLSANEMMRVDDGNERRDVIYPGFTVESNIDEKDSGVLADHVIDDHRSPPSKKKYKKSGGILSGIFKSAKSATEGVSHEVEEFVDATEQNITEEEEQIRADLSKMSLKAHDGFKNQMHDLGGAISATDRDLKEEVDVALERGKLKVHKEMEKFGERHYDEPGDTKREIVQLKDSHAVDLSPASSKKASGMNKETKEREKGFFSGIFKKAKSSAGNGENDEEKAVKIADDEMSVSEQKTRSTNNVVGGSTNKVVEFSEATIDLAEGLTESSKNDGRGRSNLATNVESAREGFPSDGSVPKIVEISLDENRSETVIGYGIDDCESSPLTKCAEKPSGLLSGVFQKTKNALGGVSREVRDFVEDSKQRVTDEETKIESQIKTTAKNVKNNLDPHSKNFEVEDSLTKRDLMGEVSLSIPETESKVQEVYHGTMTSLVEIDCRHERDFDANVMTDVQNEEKSKKKHKQKIGGFLSGIFKTAKSASVEERDGDDPISETESATFTGSKLENESRMLVDPVHEIPVEASQSSNSVEGQDITVVETQTNLDTGKEIGHSRHIDNTDRSLGKEDPGKEEGLTNEKQGLEKEFLSGILESARVIPGNVAYHVNEFLEETRRESSEEIRRIMTSPSERRTIEPTSMPSNSQEESSEIQEISGQIKRICVKPSRAENTPEKVCIDQDKNESEHSEHVIRPEIITSIDESTSPPKKEKDKTGNFFSNLLRGTKNAVAGVTHDVKNMTDEIENEVIENEEHARIASENTVQPVKEYTHKAIQNVEAALSGSGKDTAISGQMITEPMALDERKIAKIAREQRMEISQSGRADAIESQDFPKQGSPMVALTETDVQETQQGGKSHNEKGKSKAGGFLASLLRSKKQSNDVMRVADITETKLQKADGSSQRTLDDAEKDVYGLIGEFNQQVADTDSEIKEKVLDVPAKVGVTIEDTLKKLQGEGQVIGSPLTSRDGASFQMVADLDEPTHKRLTDPNVGDSSDSFIKAEKRKKSKFLSGFFQSAKNAVDGVAHGMDEFVEETKEETHRAEEKIRADSQKKSSDLETATVDAITNFDDRVQRLDEELSSGQRALDQDVANINASIKSTEDGVRERLENVEKSLNDTKTVPIDTGSTISSKIESSFKEGEVESDQMRDEISGQVASTVCKGKERSKRVLSGFFKGSKHVTEKSVPKVGETVNSAKEIPGEKDVILKIEAEQDLGPNNDTFKDNSNIHLGEKTPHKSTAKSVSNAGETIASRSTTSGISPDILDSPETGAISSRMKSLVFSEKTDRLIIEGAAVESAAFNIREDSKSTTKLIRSSSPLTVGALESESSSAQSLLTREKSDEKEFQKNSRPKSGVLSGIIKKTKGASHKVAKELGHATESLKDATEKFWEDTKSESMDSKPSGSYDVTPSMIDPEKTKDEIATNSDLRLESSNPVYSLLNISHDTESHIPKVTQSCHICEESTVQIVQESITIVQSEVSSSFSHSEPQAHQTVTTVIKKSVRTASTPPPSPAEFTDNSSQEITDEAERRAQVLIDARSLGKSGHDSAEFDEDVERHAPKLPNQPAPDHRQGNVAKVIHHPSDLRLDLKNSASPNQDQTSKIPRLVDRRGSHSNDESLSKENSKKTISDQDSFKDKTTSKASRYEIEEEIIPQRLEMSTSQESYTREPRGLDHESSPYMSTIVETVDGTGDPGAEHEETASSKQSTRERQDTWRTMSSSGEAKASAELWDTQFSADISPVSGYDDAYAKNGSRHGTVSDTDSDGSPNRRRRSMSSSKRRTMGSSSDSDVALHEGAELSPMEDDQENDLLQQNDPTFMETTTTEIDPDTHERITRVTRTTTSAHGAIDDREELRDPMHKIVDDFISEERRGQ